MIGLRGDLNLRWCPEGKTRYFAYDPADLLHLSVEEME
jgi:hypothetical protein